MRWLARVALLGVAVAIAATPAVAQPQQPSLRLIDRSPLIVQGLHFKTGERVRIEVLSEQGEAQRVTATRYGSFTTRFDEVRVGRCDALWVRATGSKGSVAVLKTAAPAACLPVRAS